MASPADGYKTLAGILSINTMMEKRLASIEKALAGGPPKKAEKEAGVKAAAGSGGSDKFMQVLVKTNQDQLISLKNIEKLLGGGSGSKLTGFMSNGDGGGKKEVTAIDAVGLMKALKMYSKFGQKKSDEFITFIKNFMTVFDDIDIDKYKEGSEAFKMMSDNVGKLVKRLVVLYPLLKIAEKSTKLLVSIIGNINKAVQSIDKDAVENSKRAGKALVYLAVGMVAITMSLVLIGMVIMSYGAEIAMGVLVVVGVAALFFLIGKKASDIKKGAMAMAMIGLSMIAIAAGFYFFALGISEAGKIISGGGGDFIIGLITAVGVLALLAVMYYTAGEFASDIMMGALAFATIGVSLVFLSFGIEKYFGVVAKIFGMEKGDGGGSVGGAIGGLFGGIVTSIAGIGLLLGLGAVFALAGFAELGIPEMIMMGALAFATIGVSLILLSFGVEKYFGVVSKMFGMDKGDGGGSGGSVGGALGGLFGGIVTSFAGITLLILLGSVFALAGLFEFGIPAMIIAGAISFAAIGVSLMILTPALEYYMNAAGRILGIKTDAGKFAGGESIGMGVATTIGGLGLLVGLGVTFALAGIASPLILAGAYALGAIGLALFSIGAGIEYYMRVAGDSDIGENLNKNLGTLRDALLTFVDGENKDGGVFGAIKGVVNGIATGGKLAMALSSAILIGPALTSIGQGIGAWANLQNMPKIIGYDKMGQPIFDTTKTVDVEFALSNIKEFLPGIIEPFIELSNRANMKKGISLFSLISGADLGESPFEEGIRVAAGIGPTLSAIAGGIGVFADLRQAPKIVGYDTKGQPLFDKSKTVDVFASMKHMAYVLKLILNPFIDLSKSANMQKSTSWLSLLVGTDFGSSPFEMGISLAGRIGAVLSSLAGGIGVFGDLTQAKKITGYDNNGQPIYSTSETTNVLGSIAQIHDIIDPNGKTSMIGPFIALGEYLANSEPFSIAGFITKAIVGVSIGKTPAEKGLAFALQIGRTLSEIGAGLGTFATATNSPQIVGYNAQGQAIYSGKTIDIMGSIANMRDILDPDNEKSMIQPLAKLGNYLNDSRPFSIGGFLTKLTTGTNLMPELSPAETGVAFALSLGRILTEIGQGLAVFVNLDNIPQITGYNADGSAIYSGKTVDSTRAISNIGLVLVSIINVLGKNAGQLKKLGSGGGLAGMISGEGSAADGMAAVGPMVGGILNALSSSLEAFASPDHIKTITGYDKTGKAIYSTTGTNLNKVLGTITKILNKIIYTVAANAGKLGMLEDAQKGAAAITTLLSGLSSPIKKFAEIEAIAKNANGTVVGITDSIVYLIKKIVPQLATYNTGGQLELAAEGAKTMEKISKSFSGGVLDMIEDIAKAPAVQFLANIGMTFEGFKKLSTVNSADPKKRTFMAQFTSEIYKLSAVSSPFSKFVAEFGKFAKHMGTFKENFSLMDVEGIMAFQSWTSAVEHLAITVEEGGLSGIVKSVDGLIDSAFGVSGGSGGKDADVSAKKDIISNASKPKDEGKPSAAAKPAPLNTKALELAMSTLTTKINTLVIAINNNTAEIVN